MHAPTPASRTVASEDAAGAPVVFYDAGSVRVDSGTGIITNWPEHEGTYAITANHLINSVKLSDDPKIQAIKDKLLEEMKQRILKANKGHLGYFTRELFDEPLNAFINEFQTEIEQRLSRR